MATSEEKVLGALYSMRVRFDELCVKDTCELHILFGGWSFEFGALEDTLRTTMM